MSKTHRLVISLVVLVFLGSVITFNVYKNHMIAEYFANSPPPAFPVTVQRINAQTWKPKLSAFGFIEPYQGVTLATESGGTVTHIAFESGQHVTKGQLLLALDTSVEQAQLDAQQALLPAKERKMKRALKLFQDRSISEDEKDDAVAEYFSLKSQVKALTAAINRRRLQAPFDGIVGLRNVYLGEYLNAGHPVVQLEDISTMRIRFSIPQTDLSRIYVNQQLDVEVDAYPEEGFQGTIKAIEPTVNAQSGVVEVLANIPNDRQVLRSGMFARLQILLNDIPLQTIIPQSAIEFNLYGETLFVIDEQATASLINNVDSNTPSKTQAIVKRISIEVKERSGHLALIDKGLNPGDRIITSGQVRLSTGSQVRFVDSNALTPMTQVPSH